MTDFGNYIQLVRKAEKMTVISLAEQVGVSPGFIRGIERGQQHPSLVTARKICESLKLGYAVEDKYLICGEHRFYFKAKHKGDNSTAFPYRDRENVQPGSQCTTILDWGSKPETDEKVVTRFWIEESGFSDLDTGMVLWSDGKAEHAIDVTRELDPRRLGFLTHKLEKLAPGLTLEQLYFLYMGVLSESVGADDEFFIEAERRGWDD